MGQRLVAWLVLLILLYGWPGGSRAQTNSAKDRQDTNTEILYRNHYTNCEGGYAVDLPAGVVAHRDKAASNRGFQIDLSAPGDTRPFSASEQRFIAVSDQDNVLELPSLAAIVDNDRDSELEDRPDWSLLERLPFRLGGLPATQLRARFKGKKMMDEEILAYRPQENGRDDMIYKIQLITPQSSSAGDRTIFDRIVSGFHRLAWGPGGCP
jgi:hypothetical protein